MALTQSLTLSNGVLIPQLGLGVWQSESGKETEDAVSWALKAGYRHIDTAVLYKNEESVGKAVAASNIPREEIFITTKLWNSDQGYESTLRAFDDSLKRLGLTYLDLYLIHWPGKNKYLDTWRAFEKLYEEKKVRAIGVSNFQKHHLDDVLKHCKVRPMVNQIELHPRNTQEELREYCKERDIVVTAWSPLGQGQLLTDPKLMSIAQKYSKSPAQVILRWELQLGVVIIPKSVHEERIKENTKIFDFELKPDDMKAIDEMNTNHRYGPHPDHHTLDFE